MRKRPSVVSIPVLIILLLTTNNINVHQQAAPQRVVESPILSATNRIFRFLKKKRAASGEYLLDIIKEVQEAELQWRRMLKAIEDELSAARKMNIAVDDDEAYLRCYQLLSEEFQVEQQKFSKVRRKLKMGIQTVEERIGICEEQQKQGQKQKAIIQEQVRQLEASIGKVVKRQRKQEQIRQITEQQLSVIENSNLRLQQLKEQSYKQKGLYLQAQETEMNMLQEIGKIEEEQQIYYDFKSREEKYRQLTKILQKLHNKSSFSNKDVESYLKDKICEMSVLRTDLLSIDEKLEQFDVLLQEQNYIIEGLKYKSESYKEVDNSAYRKYQSKYEDLYFNRNNNLDNWKSYKNYLQELLKKNKVQHHLKSGQNDVLENSNNSRYKVKSSYVKNHPHKTEPSVFEIIDQEPSLSPSFKNIHTPQLLKKMSQRLSERQSESRSVKLPKLVRMTGKKGDQLKIKQNLRRNIKKMINESDISLESVDSDQDNMSGEFIEVQFHKK